MPMSNAMRSDVLDMAMKGVDPSWRAGASMYMAYVSDVSPDPANPLANELTYTGYQRKLITKSTAWTGSGVSRTNAALIQGYKRTDGGAAQTINCAVFVDTASGAAAMHLIGALAVPMVVQQNIQPQHDAGTITITAT